MLQEVYGDLASPNMTHIANRSILTPTNAEVDSINNIAVAKFPGQVCDFGKPLLSD